MTQVISRAEFQAYFNQLQAGLGAEDSPLWIPEQREGCVSEWFVCTKTQNWDKQEFWQWCSQHCRGSVLCYSCGDEAEWWGFSHRQDLDWWLLRWC